MSLQDRKFCFIVGAMKAGTSTLAAQLGRQDGAYLPVLKEPNYFRGNLLSLIDGPSPHATQFMASHMSGEDYAALFNPAKATDLLIDASTSYLVNPQSPGQVRNFAPDARIVVSLRDPTERAYSAYNFVASGVGDPEQTFAAAVASEQSGQREQWVFGWRHLYGGLYDRHLRSWLNAFPAEQILVVDFANLVSDGEAAIEKVCKFMGIDYDSQKFSPEVENATSLPHPINGQLRRALLGPSALKAAIKPLIPSRLRLYAKKETLRGLRKFGQKPDKMPDTIRSMLDDHYRESMQETERLLEKAFGLNGEANPATRWLQSRQSSQMQARNDGILEK